MSRIHEELEEIVVCEMETDEDFRVIPGFTRYLISEDGVMWSRKRRGFYGKFIMANRDIRAFIFPDNGEKKNFLIKDLIALAWPELESDD